jgi:hypothetical protein
MEWQTLLPHLQKSLHPVAGRAMIKTLGEERTEGIVRAWMANQPRIFESDSNFGKR